MVEVNSFRGTAEMRRTSTSLRLSSAVTCMGDNSIRAVEQRSAIGTPDINETMLHTRDSQIPRDFIRLKDPRLMPIEGSMVIESTGIG